MVLVSDAFRPKVTDHADMDPSTVWIAHNRPGTTPHLLALRDVEQHHQRRKLWNHGFTSSSLKELQPAVEDRVLQLVEELSNRASPKEGKDELLDLAQWIANFT